mgnify:CR=1 FL=1
MATSLRHASARRGCIGASQRPSARTARCRVVASLPPTMVNSCTGKVGQADPVRRERLIPATRVWLNPARYGYGTMAVSCTYCRHWSGLLCVEILRASLRPLKGIMLPVSARFPPRELRMPRIGENDSRGPGTSGSALGQPKPSSSGLGSCSQAQLLPSRQPALQLPTPCQTTRAILLCTCSMPRPASTKC